MKRILIAAWLMAAVCVFAAGAEKAKTDDGMATRVFGIPPTIVEKIGEAAPVIARESTAGGIVEQPYGDMKKYFADLGVAWPEGASVRYDPTIGKLLVTNTPENMAKLEAVLAELNIAPAQIEIEVDFVVFPLAAVEPLVQKGAVTVDSLRDLWRSGTGILLASPVIVTQSGSEATVKGVKEYIYPTEYTVTAPSSTNDPGTNHVGAIHVQEGELSAIVEPGGFETREAGAILQVVPEIAPDGTMINLTMNSQFVCDPTWKDYGFEVASSNGPSRKFRMEMPFFYTYTATTCISARNGQTLLIGGGIPSQDGQKLVYILVTARKVDTSGKVLPTKE
jgi:type II secretory pathway component HofQ